MKSKSQDKFFPVFAYITFVTLNNHMYSQRAPASCTQVFILFLRYLQKETRQKKKKTENKKLWLLAHKQHQGG